MRARVIDRESGAVLGEIEADTAYALFQSLLDFGEQQAMPRYQVPARLRTERLDERAPAVSAVPAADPAAPVAPAADPAWLAPPLEALAELLAPQATAERRPRRTTRRTVASAEAEQLRLF